MPKKNTPMMNQYPGRIRRAFRRRNSPVSGSCRSPFRARGRYSRKALSSTVPSTQMYPDRSR